MNESTAPSLTRCKSVVSLSAFDFLVPVIYKDAGNYQTVIRILDSAAAVTEDIHGRLDTAAIAGSAVFSALAIVLAGASQALGLNFPLIPYLQFDVGEVAIILAFFIFGPIPALVSSFVEFAGLMAFGQQVPIGPLLKLAALVSTVAGLWLGARLVSRARWGSLGGFVGSSGIMGAITRAAAMTVANYYLLIYIYGLTGTVSYYDLARTFSALGIGLTGSNTLFLILFFSAIFNVIQLVFVMGASYLVLRLPIVNQLRIGGRVPWFTAVLGESKKSTAQRLR